MTLSLILSTQILNYREDLHIILVMCAFLEIKILLTHKELVSPFFFEEREENFIDSRISKGRKNLYKVSELELVDKAQSHTVV